MNNIQYPGPQQEYKVLVRCFTYNQSKYIEDALNGFVMQQTTFPFVCLVMDDASTDGEQDVIRAWMERECDMNKAETIDIPTSIVIIVPHKTNTSCTFAFYLLKYNLYGTREKKMNHVYPWREKCEYEALCEGDDYWIDPLKLQKQVDFLDNNPNSSLVYTAFENVNEKKYIIDKSYHKFFLKRSHSGDCLLELLKGNYIMTLTVCFRKEVMNLPFFKTEIPQLDYFLFLCATELGDFGYLPDTMACYRKVETSETNSNKQTIDKCIKDIFIYFSTCFLQGKLRKRSVFNSIRIKYTIAERTIRISAVYTSKVLFDLVKADNWLLFYLLIALIMVCLKKVLLIRSC